jgi:glycosyltransferase involved in cell wall biosynthesis
MELKPTRIGAPELTAVATEPAAGSVSVVIPCRNEAGSIERLLDALRAQDWPIHEAVVVDDGSTDDTAGILEAYASRFPDFPLRVLSGAAAGIPAAVNAGARTASGEIIIRLDAHSRPAPDYVRWSVSALDCHDAGVAGGVWEVAPGADTLIARAIARAVSHPMGAGDAAYRTGRALGEAHEVDTVPFGCFRKALWEEIGGFNERLLTNEDYEFNYRVRRSGRRVVMDPRIRSTYYARTTLSDLARQYFRYGWWKAQMLKANPASLRWRQAVPAGFVAVLTVLIGSSFFFRPAAVMLFGLVLVYLSALLVASGRICGGRRTWKILPVLPAVFATIHFTWGAGVLVNLLTLGKWPAMNGTRRQSAEPN